MRDSELPSYLSFLNIPAAGLGYMSVFFHELGHTVTFYSYGQAAVPVFNFTDGGGFATPFLPRFLILQGVIYLGVLYVGWLLYSEGMFAALIGLGVILAVHLYFTFGEERYMLAVNFMGHGGATVMGCYCALRALMNKTYSDHSPLLERYINMIFGIFAVGRNEIRCWLIIFDPHVRADYLAGIGGHIANDFTVIADRLETDVQHVAMFGIGFDVLCVIITAVIFFLYWREHGFEEKVKI